MSSVSGQMQLIETVIKHPTVKPLVNEFMKLVENEFANDTPLAMSFRALCDIASDVNHEAMSELDMPTRYASAALVNTMLKMKTFKSNKKG